MEDYIYFTYLLIVLLAGIVAWIFYDLFAKTGRKNRMKEKIKKMFNGQERDGNVYFEFRGYDVIVTFKPDIKVSILHSRNVEELHPPRGAKLTPLYLTFKVKNIRNMTEKLNDYMDFLDAIPIQ